MLREGAGNHPVIRRLLAFGLAVFFPVLALVGAPSSSAEETPPPSIVLILTDDQRWDTLWAMPTVQSELQTRGVTFSNAFVVNSLCCPSRTSILTGKYSHSTGVYNNTGFTTFDDGSTVATWLHDGGYRTGLIGKYLNQYQGPYVPPGWDRWVAFRRHNYRRFSLVVDGAEVKYPRSRGAYSTDVLADEADAFIRGTDPSQSLFLMFTPYAPHEPAIPAERHEDAFAGLGPWRPESFNERNVSDKPAHVQALPPLDKERKVELRRFRRNQYRTLLAVDEAVARILTALEETGRLSTTLVVFAADNGYTWGEHRWEGKVVSYEESVRVPFVLRYDPLAPADTTDGRIALNVDLAPTFAELAGVAAPDAEGSSLLPLLSPGPVAWRSDFLIEHGQLSSDPGSLIPPFCAVRTATMIYAYYSTGEDELYDLVADPFQLVNEAARSQWADEVATLRGRLAELCSPSPPGLTLPDWGAGP
ncbi:MAG TPA: sulfatase [Actinomycetota bacterium]|nr:sulfatase [Actinomycetota bacterium]